MVRHKVVPKAFWAYVVVTAVYLRNMLTCCTQPPDTTPFELSYKANPDIDHVERFGLSCFYHVSKDKARNLGDRRKPAMLLGYSKSQKAYKLWKYLAESVVLSRDVRLHGEKNGSLLGDHSEWKMCT